MIQGRLVATEESRRSVVRLTEFMSTWPKRMGNRQRRMIRDEIARGFQRNFTFQASGSGVKWASLALVTQRERRRLGFAGNRPILVRSGEYRSSLVNLDHPLHESETGSMGNGGVFFEEGSGARIAPFHEGGTRWMPARPATILSGASLDSLGQVIESIMASLEREALR